MKKSIHSFKAMLFAISIFLFLFTESSFGQRNPILGAGNSYVNVSKRNTGGVVQTGDTLEIRTTYFFAGTYNSVNSNTLYRMRYFDSVPLKTTMLTGTTDSLRLITNEGITFRKYTLAASDDPATYVPAPGSGKYQVRINIGQHNLVAPGIPTASSEGTLTDISGAGNARIGSGATRYKPQLFSGLLITTAFRVKVTGVGGDTIVLGIGKFVYRKTSGGSDTIINATPYKILISSNSASGLCGNALGANLASEYGGTFDLGNTQNRTAGPAFSIPNYDYKLLSRSVSIGDGNYSFVNNMSPAGGTNFNARMQPNCNIPAGPIPVNDSCSKRMHGGFWDIIGDHTGTNTTAGNPAVAPGSSGGYMLVVNSDVVTSEAYRQNVTGLCPDTYYEFSAWLRNICKRCGIDSNSTSIYNPGALPNLAFSINGLDIYSTGQMDTVGWQKKGFVFKTGPGQTNAIISIRNNAPGGGGNDWAMDDVALGTCGPSMSFNFKPLFLGCKNGAITDLSDTVRYSYNPNYSSYKWERSTNNGVSWGTPPTPTTGTISPTLVNGYYQFVTNYPQFVAGASDSGHLYRVVVATSNANLASTSCSFTDGSSILLSLITCPPALENSLVSFNGRLLPDNKSILKWIISSEKDLLRYEVEKSKDGFHFVKVVGVIAGNAIDSRQYEYRDPEMINSNTWFRLKIFNTNQLYKYSNAVLLNRTFSFTVNSLVNPFSSTISANIILPENGIVKMTLFDSYGKLVGSENKKLAKGLNLVEYNGWDKLSRGIYFISFGFNNSRVQSKLTKSN